MRKILLITFVVFSIGPLFGYWYLYGSPLPRLNFRDPITWVSLYGLVAGYIGVFFSAFAAIEVYGLSTRYRSKIRLPMEKRKLTKVTTRLSEASAENARSLLSGALMSEIMVCLNSIVRLSDGTIKQNAKKALKLHAEVVDWARANIGSEEPMHSCQHFYTLYEQLNVVKLEIDNSIADEKAT